jgi:AcrR family transcriptional regulator
VTVVQRTLRADRANATREVILAAAERLFAEQGVTAVSNRQICEAAGQGNNAAVGYHFGTKTDLVRAIIEKHSEHITALRREMVARVADSTDVREWVACQVQPLAEHLAAVAGPTWFARFGAQAHADPVFRDIMIEVSSTEPLRRIIEGLHRCLPELPADVREERGEMSMQLIAHFYAERERVIAEGVPSPADAWQAAATGLTDALVGLWLAPVTPRT